MLTLILEDQMKSILDHELMKLQNHSLSGGFVFGFDENKIILQKLGRLVGSTAVGWSTCGDIVKFFIERDGSLSTGGKKRSGVSQQVIIFLFKCFQSLIRFSRPSA